MKKTALLMSLACLSLSCKRDKIDFKMADDLRFNPEFEIPLIKARLSLANLVIKDSTFVVGADNSLSIRYVKDSIFSYDASDLLAIPEQRAFTFPMSPQLIPYDFNMSLGSLNGVELANSKFKNGFLALELSAATPFFTPVDVEVTIKNGQIAGASMTKIITLPAGISSFRDSLNIASGEIDFSAGGINHLGIKVEILNAQAVNPQTGILDLSCQFHSLELESAYGNFGQQYIRIPSSALDFDISGYNQFINGLYLTNPQIRLIATSSLGININLETDFDGINSGGELTSLVSPPLQVSGPDVPGTTKTDTITFNRNNSTIVDFMASLPTSILYSGAVGLNPGGSGVTNFVQRGAKVNANMEIELPLELRADNLIMEQTLESLKFMQDSASEVTAANLIFNTKNGFPFDVNLSLSLIDTLTNDSIDGISLRLLTAPPVDADGRVIRRSESREVVALRHSTIENMKRAGKLLLKARVRTPDNGQTAVTLYTDYDLEVKIAAQLSLNVKP